MAKQTKKVTSTVEDKLKALHQLQMIDTEVDKIRIIRGELPLEIQDLEDLIAGLNTRFDKFNEDNPVIINPGDRVTFYKINKDEYLKFNE